MPFCTWPLTSPWMRSTTISKSVSCRDICKSSRMQLKRSHVAEMSQFKLQDYVRSLSVRVISNCYSSLLVFFISSSTRCWCWERPQSVICLNTFLTSSWSFITSTATCCSLCCHSWSLNSRYWKTFSQLNIEAKLLCGFLLGWSL